MDPFPLLPDGLTLRELGTLAAILGVSGLMSGLSGFGFSAIGAICLWILPPTLGVPLLMALSMANQMTSLRQLKADMKPIREWWPDGPAPYLLGGLIGIPIGLELLYVLPPPVLMIGFGCILTSYAAYSSLKPEGLRLNGGGGWRLSALVGGTGGIIGGFTAFPGAAVVIWSGLRHLPGTEARAIIQPYILCLQLASFSLIAIRHPQSLGPAFWILMLLMLPVVLPCTLLGVRLYRSLTDLSFRRLAFVLLGLSGTGILAKGIAGTPMVKAAATAAIP